MEEKLEKTGSQKRHLRCPKCGRELQFADPVCPFCGKNIGGYLFVRRHIWLVLVLAGLLVWTVLNFSTIKMEVRLFFHDVAAEIDSRKLPDYDIEYYEVPGVEFKDRHTPGSGWLEFYGQVPSEDSDLFRDAATVMESCMGNSRESYLDQMSEMGYEEEAARRALDALKIDFQEQVKRAVKWAFACNSFSEQGIREELREQGFSEDEIDFAVSYSNADYKKQARMELQSILELSAESPGEAEQWLRDKGFSEEEILWAFENTEVDWELMACLMGKKFLRIGYAEKADLRLRLVQHGFTEEQAAAAAEKLHAE